MGNCLNIITNPGFLRMSRLLQTGRLFLSGNGASWFNKTDDAIKKVKCEMDIEELKLNPQVPKE